MPWKSCRRVARHAVAAVTAAALWMGFAAAFAQAATAPATPIGAHSMLQLDDPPSFMQAMFAQAAAMGASAIRLDIAPAIVFSDPSQPPDFSGLDEVVALARQYQLQVVGDLFTVPWWIANCQGPTPLTDMDRCGTDQLGQYASMISQIVARAGSAIDYWEVWNEPDTAQFFTGTPQQYAAMLRAAHDAIKAANPDAQVLLGGISGTGGMSWLAQVFAVPGPDAAHAFDIANIHERGGLDQLTFDLAGWRRFLSGYGFAGPLWVTEHGYPADPAFQYDPSYASGATSQAAYLTASIPTLLDSGAAMVFVTERDNLTGQFASEGVLGGDVADPPPADPQILQKPAYAAVQGLAFCYAELGRDCPEPGPAAAPASLLMPATAPGGSSTSTVTVSDPGAEPLQLRPAGFVVSGSPALILGRNSCSGQLLEPNETCHLSVRFKPVVGGTATGFLHVQSDQGALNVPMLGVAPSVSSLTATAARRLGRPTTGLTQKLALTVTNPLPAAVSITTGTVRDAQGGRFAIRKDGCASMTIAPRQRCRVTLTFTASRTDVGRAVLVLRGAGRPLQLRLYTTLRYP